MDDYQWQTASSPATSFKTETTRNLGWWILLAVLVSIILHVALFVALGDMAWITKAPGAAEEEVLIPVNINKQLTIDQKSLDDLLETPKAEPEIKPEALSELDMLDDQLDEFEELERMKDEDIKLTPEVDTTKIFSTEKPTMPAAALATAVESIDVSAAEMLSKDLQSMREQLLENSIASQDQPTLELNKDDYSKAVDTDDFFRKAASTALGDGADKVMEGYTNLNAIANTGGGLPSGETKIAIPTDILFEYNEYELKEAARLSMMKLAFIVQTNPDATFVIEGHTDSFGADEYNIELSLKRAAAVRDWLVNRLQINAANVKVVGVGKKRLLIPDGDADQQALNRRVEIIVRK